MATSRQLRILATRPHAMQDWRVRGRLAQGIRPESPLLDVLRQIAPLDRAEIMGLCVDERLGYRGSRRFATAAHAMYWLAPAPEVFGSFPAHGCRIASFAGPLALEDVVACCERIPQNLLGRYQRLCRKPGEGLCPGPHPRPIGGVDESYNR